VKGFEGAKAATEKMAESAARHLPWGRTDEQRDAATQPDGAGDEAQLGTAES
jgi:hypothetical protein